MDLTHIAVAIDENRRGSEPSAPGTEAPNLDGLMRVPVFMSVLNDTREPAR
jgi:hypothetical protein